jgi:prepilin-type N-terminal cleavage/methylation domain-containing protein
MFEAAMVLRTLADPDPKRPGFTLVEMLVVIAIIGIIAGIGVYAIQPFQGRASVNNAAVQLQSWLNAARSRAIRDRAPRGLRLLPGDEVQNDTGTNISTLVTKAIFIDQPDDITGVGVTAQGVPPIKSLTITNGPAATEVTPGDYIEVGGGTVHEIAGYTVGNVTLKNAFPYTIPPPGTNIPYRIIRSPKAAATVPTTNATASTQDVLRVPRGSAINVGANNSFNAAYKLTFQGSPANVTNSVDIMFDPSGAVMPPAINSDKIILWVTGTARDTAGVISPTQGQPALVVVYTKSGAIAGYTADLASGNPYSQVP